MSSLFADSARDQSDLTILIEVQNRYTTYISSSAPGDIAD